MDFNGLDGLEYLWRIALECRKRPTAEKDVVPKAIALLNKVHEKLSEALKPQVGTIRNQYIQVVMTHAKKYLSQEKTVRHHPLTHPTTPHRHQNSTAHLIYLCYLVGCRLVGLWRTDGTGRVHSTRRAMCYADHQSVGRV